MIIRVQGSLIKVSKKSAWIGQNNIKNLHRHMRSQSTNFYFILFHFDTVLFKYTKLALNFLIHE